IVERGKLKSGSEIFNFLDHIDIYIHPSLTEGLPRAVIEAMSRACPVLVSNAGGLPELVNLEFVHKAGDFTVLYQSIKSLGSNKEKLMQSAKQNYLKSKIYDNKFLEQKRSNFITQIVKKYL